MGLEAAAVSRRPHQGRRLHPGRQFGARRYAWLGLRIGDEERGSHRGLEAVGRAREDPRDLGQSDAPASARAANDREPRSPLRAYWSVYEFNPPSAELDAGGRVEKHSNGMPRICWHTILSCGNPQWYGKPWKQRGLLSRQGGHSSRYWCQQDSVFAQAELVPAKAAIAGCLNKATS